MGAQQLGAMGVEHTRYYTLHYYCRTVCAQLFGIVLHDVRQQ